jgi:hypothetical protein
MYRYLFGYNYEFDLKLHNNNEAEWSRDLHFCMYDKIIFDLIFLRVSKYQKYSINSTIRIERYWKIEVVSILTIYLHTQNNLLWHLTKHKPPKKWDKFDILTSFWRVFSWCSNKKLPKSCQKVVIKYSNKVT